MAQVMVRTTIIIISKIRGKSPSLVTLNAGTSLLKPMQVSWRQTFPFRPSMLQFRSGCVIMSFRLRNTGHESKVTQCESSFHYMMWLFIVYIYAGSPLCSCIQCKRSITSGLCSLKYSLHVLRDRRVCERTVSERCHVSSGNQHVLVSMCRRICRSKLRDQ